MFLTREVPIPPLFLVRPLRMMRPPLDGRLPVIAQIRDIGVPLLEIERWKVGSSIAVASVFLINF